MKYHPVLAIVFLLALWCAAPHTFSQQGKSNEYGTPHKTDSPDKEAKAKKGKDHLGAAIHTETKDNLLVEVWLVTQQQHDQLMPAAKDETAVEGYKPREDGSELSKDALEKPDTPDKKMDTRKGPEIRSTPYPTMAVVKVSEDGKNVEKADVELFVTSPVNKTVTLSLESMKDHYAQDVQLTEKGTYKFTLKISHKGKTTTMNFSTSVPAS